MGKLPHPLGLGLLALRPPWVHGALALVVETCSSPHPRPPDMNPYLEVGSLQVKMRAFGWALIQHGWCPHKKRTETQGEAGDNGHRDGSHVATSPGTPGATRSQERQEGRSSRASGDGMALRTPGFGSSKLHEWKEQISVVLSLPLVASGPAAPGTP